MGSNTFYFSFVITTTQFVCLLQVSEALSALTMGSSFTLARRFWRKGMEGKGGK